MSLLFGSVICDGCGSETRFTKEVEDGRVRTILIGDRAEAKLPRFDCVCDYCRNGSSVYPVVVDRVLSAFLNRNEHEAYLGGDLSVTAAKPGEGLRREAGSKPHAKTGITSPFRHHPKPKGSVFRFGNGETWRVQAVFRKEWVERDPEKRMAEPVAEEYWYRVQRDGAKKRWVSVREEKGVNTFLHEGDPVVGSEQEILVELTDAPQKPKKTYESDWMDGLSIEVYQYVSGARLLVVNSKNEIEADLFGETAEEVFDILENWTTLEMGSHE